MFQICSETGRHYSYTAARDHSGRIAQALRSRLGLDRGNVFAVIMPNVPEYCLILLGAAESGVIATTINPNYKPDEMATQLKQSNAKAIITLSSMYDTVKAAKNLVKEIKHNIPIVTVRHLVS